MRSPQPEDGAPTRRDRPYPPGAYPVVVVGSGPGALQIAYSLRALGVEAAVISADEEPGGMFRRLPKFGRLLTTTKPHVPVPQDSREYERFDHNSLLAAPEHRVRVIDHMSGAHDFPTRAEMADSLLHFARKAEIRVRYGCRWEATRQHEDGFVLSTSDGEYRCRLAVFAVGWSEPWKPTVPGIDVVPHYVETRAPEEYPGRRVLIVGKRNSAFEVADALLPWATQLVLVSPGPTRLAVCDFSIAGARARYIQPFEHHVFGHGTFVLSATVRRIERRAEGYRVQLAGRRIGREVELEVDEVIAATGFRVPLGDLRTLGVATFAHGRLPALTPFWESSTVPGIFFAGSSMQGAPGLRKHGSPSLSSAVHGFRHNAVVLAGHLAARLGHRPRRASLAPGELVPFLLAEATHAPELHAQKSYLARAVELHPADGPPRDAGVLPLEHFVDAKEGSAVAIAVESTTEGEIRPAVYVRRARGTTEHILDSHPMLDFETPEHHRQLAEAIRDLAP